MHQINQVSAATQLKVDQDLSDRVNLGIAIYLAAWAAIAYGNGLHKTLPTFTHGVAIFFIVIALGRLWLKSQIKAIRVKSRKTWLWCIYPSVLLPSIAWGIIIAYAFTTPSLSEIKLFMLVAAAGIGSGSVSTFAPDRLLSNLFVAALVTPVAITNMLGEQQDLIWGLLIIIYIAFNLSLAKRQSEEYWVAVLNEEKLQDQHALLQKLNQRDSLTGLYNRGYFDEIIDKEWTRAHREKSNLALLVIDIDFFKTINDRYGHLAGDRCLTQIANTISHVASRRTDVVTRYGGEEFAVLLPNTEQGAAVELAEKIRLAVNAEKLNYNSQEFQVTISAGVAALKPTNDSKAYDLFEAADQALYRAKQSGRNCVISTVV